MIKITDEQGKILFKVEDDATEPEEVTKIETIIEKPEPKKEGDK